MSAVREVYLDNNATTPVDEEVLDLFIETLRDNYGNPSSAHARGARARRALEQARERVAALLHASPSEVVFTSGGTEGNNAAIAAALQMRPGRKRVVLSTVEHPAVRLPMRQLALSGFDVREIPVGAGGELDLVAAAELITPDTALVSVMAANNETGVVLPFEAVAELAAARGAIMHVDAVQAVSRVPIDPGRIPIDLLTISGHKLHAPKGIGALYVRKGLRLPPFIHGGHQEHGQRGGTENVPGAAALGKACELFLACDYGPVRELRDLLEVEVLRRIPRARVNGAGAPRVANTLSVAFEHVESDSLVHLLSNRGIHVSTGSACASGTMELSHVLTAMGVPVEYAQGTIRLSLSVYTTRREIERTIDALPDAVAELRELSPLWPPAEDDGFPRAAPTLSS